MQWPNPLCPQFHLQWRVIENLESEAELYNYKPNVYVVVALKPTVFQEHSTFVNVPVVSRS